MVDGPAWVGGPPDADESLLALPDSPLQRFGKRVAGDEGLFERRDADPLGALREQPTGELRHLVACAMQRDEPVRGSKRFLGGS